MSRILAIVVSLSTAQVVSADGLGLPLQQRVRVVQRIEAAEAFPNHVFVVYRSHWKNDEQGQSRKYEEATYTTIDPTNPIVLRTAVARENLNLLIVPRMAAAAHPTANELAAAVFRNEIPGATSGSFHDRDSAPAWAGDEVTFTYRIQKSRSGDGLELVRVSWHPLWQWDVAAFSATAAVVLGGLWLIRRMRRRAAPTPAPPQQPPG